IKMLLQIDQQHRLTRQRQPLADTLEVPEGVVFSVRVLALAGFAELLHSDDDLVHHMSHFLLGHACSPPCSRLNFIFSFKTWSTSMLCCANQWKILIRASAYSAAAPSGLPEP